jgi:TolB protein
MRGARRCYIGASIAWERTVSSADAVPYRVTVEEDGGFVDPGPPIPEPPDRTRRALTVVVLLALIVSIVFLAFISGRGIVQVVPPIPPSAAAVTPSPSAPPNASRLAIVDAAGGLSITDGSGGSVVGYGDAGIAFSFPAWSPDGTRIAVIGQSADESDVYIFTVHAAGTPAVDPTIVYRSPDRPPFYLYWAPDGRQVTFLTTEPDGIALRLAPADARSQPVVLRTGAPIYWAWADPTRLLIHSGDDGPDGFLAEVGTDGASVEPEVIQPGGFRVPAVTSDGRYRAFVLPGQGTAAQIVVEGRDRKDPHSIDVFGAAAIDFGPGTDELAFLAPAVAGREVPLPVGPLRLIDSVSGQVRTLLAGSVVSFFWSPDGATIAALEIAGTGDDQVATVSTRSAATTAATTGLALRLVFVTVESGAIRAQRPLMVSDTFVQQVIPFFDQYALSHRLWSADGTAVVIPIVGDDGADRLEVVRADGSDARAVAAGVSAFWAP